MGKGRTLRTDMVFVCYLVLKETNIHFNLMCFDRNFHYPDVNVVTFVPQETVQKATIFPQNT